MARFPALRRHRGSPRSKNSGEDTHDRLVANIRRNCSSTDDLGLGLNSYSDRSSPPPYTSVDMLKRRSHLENSVDSVQSPQGRTRGGGCSHRLGVTEPVFSPRPETSPMTPPSITLSPATEQQRPQQQDEEPSTSRVLAPLQISSAPLSRCHSSWHAASVSNEELYSIPRLPTPAPNATAISISDTVRLFTSLVGIAWCIAVPILWTTLGKQRSTHASATHKTNSLFRGQLTAACGLAALGGILIEVTLSIVATKRRARRYRAVAAMRRSTRRWCSERGVDEAEAMAGLSSYSMRDRDWFRAALVAVMCIVIVLMVLVGFVLK